MPLPRCTNQQQLDRARRELARLGANLKAMETAVSAVDAIHVWALREYARRAVLNCNVLIALANTVEKTDREEKEE